MRASRSGFLWWLPGLMVLASLAAAPGCVDSMPGGMPDDASPDGASPPDGAPETAAVTLVEGFEAGTKTAYAAADVTLASGVWNLDDALIGTMATDVKTETRSGRLRNSGKITMKFDRTGAGTVTIHHASFGSDANGMWGLFASQNAGGSWAQIGTSRSTTAGSFSTATFTVNLGGAIRFEIRKLDGGANRINVDDISITDFAGGGAALSVHTTLGIPAPTSTSDPAAFLSIKSGYVISYNSTRKVPNWVSWELNTTYLGATARQDDFRPDDTLPATLPQASLADYVGSGFDRGHMCPSADRNLTVAANSQTFYLSNMVPQAPNNNRGPWAQLEADMRDIALTGKELFIISGGVFSASSTTIGSGVGVPDKTFKVIVVLDAPGQGAANVTSATRVIGVMMPNSNALITQSTPWRTFRVSVDAIEAATGDNFLSDVDAAVQAVVEARVDNL